MVKTLNVPLVGARRHGPPPAARGSRRPGGEHWLVLVAAAFTLAQLVLVRPGMGLGWDETVYVSQVSPHAPAAFFSAPRARGVPLLVAPISSWLSSTPLVRVCLALLLVLVDAYVSHGGPPSDVVRAGQREPVAGVTTPAERPPAYVRDWASHRAGDLRVHVAPGAGGGTV